VIYGSDKMKYHKLVENAVKPEGFWGKLMIRSMNKGHSDLTDWALCHIDIKSGDYVLDAGCGGGKTVGKLANMVGSGKVYGIDYSDLCIKRQKS
jgi:ubiquinone/menaquinone biosynthesis C-methylase UbiE